MTINPIQFWLCILFIACGACYLAIRAVARRTRFLNGEKQ